MTPLSILCFGENTNCLPACCWGSTDQYFKYGGGYVPVNNGVFHFIIRNIGPNSLASVAVRLECQFDWLWDPQRLVEHTIGVSIKAYSWGLCIVPCPFLSGTFSLLFLRIKPLYYATPFCYNVFGASPSWTETVRKLNLSFFKFWMLGVVSQQGES